MYLIDGLIVVAMTFLFILPMTDARTARMKLSVVSCLGVLLAASVVAPRLTGRRAIWRASRVREGCLKRGSTRG
jgi:hypothetical protein